MAHLNRASHMLFLRNVLYIALIPGVVVGAIPYAIVGGTHAEIAGGASLAFAAVLLAAGLAFMAWCIRDFAVQGRGTLSPTDPPIALVRAGLYRYVRNPMYLGALLVLAGEIVMFQSRGVLLYAVIWFGWWNVFIIFYEEPTLRRTFGAAYVEYCRDVARWVPRRPTAPTVRAS